jgi:hypothetical protein
LEFSQSLEAKCLAEGVSPGHLAAQIDSALKSLHAVLDQQIAEARSTLTLSRNKIVSPVYRLPEEVLSQIFMDALYGYSDIPDVDESRVVDYYRRLHHLIGVCSAWKNVIVSRGVFWSIVPMIYSGFWALKTERATRLSLERAQERPLHLTAHLSFYAYDRVSEYASRFRTVNISTRDNSNEVMRRLLHDIIFPGTPEPLSLSQLSLCHIYDAPYYSRLPLESDYIMRNCFPEHRFNVVVNNLAILRIRGAQFYWDHISFSHHLTELHLQDVLVGYDTSLMNLFGALSSAAQLRDLKLIGIKAFPVRNTLVGRYISLPSLKTLLLRDLYFNVLAICLSTITSRSHHLTLFLNRKCRCLNLLGNNQSQDIDIHALNRLLYNASVHTLFLDGGREYGWLPAVHLRNLLSSTSYLDTLWINKWDLDADSCFALRSVSYPQVIPNLKELSFVQTRVRSEQAFKNMVISRSESVQLLRIGVEFVNEAGVPFNESNIGLSKWLQENVSNPSVIEINADDEPYELKEVEWRMWS